MMIKNAGFVMFSQLPRFTWNLSMKVHEGHVQREMECPAKLKLFYELSQVSGGDKSIVDLLNRAAKRGFENPGPAASTIRINEDLFPLDERPLWNAHKELEQGSSMEVLVDAMRAAIECGRALHAEVAKAAMA